MKYPLYIAGSAEPTDGRAQLERYFREVTKTVRSVRGYDLLDPQSGGFTKEEAAVTRLMSGEFLVTTSGEFLVTAPGSFYWPLTELPDSVTSTRRSALPRGRLAQVDSQKDYGIRNLPRCVPTGPFHLIRSRYTCDLGASQSHDVARRSRLSRIRWLQDAYNFRTERNDGHQGARRIFPVRFRDPHGPTVHSRVDSVI